MKNTELKKLALASLLHDLGKVHTLTRHERLGAKLLEVLAPRDDKHAREEWIEIIDLVKRHHDEWPGFLKDGIDIENMKSLPQRTKTLLKASIIFGDRTSSKGEHEEERRLIRQIPFLIDPSLSSELCVDIDLQRLRLPSSIDENLKLFLSALLRPEELNELSDLIEIQAVIPKDTRFNDLSLLAHHLTTVPLSSFAYKFLTGHMRFFVLCVNFDFLDFLSKITRLPEYWGKLSVLSEALVNFSESLNEGLLDNGQSIFNIAFMPSSIARAFFIELKMAEENVKERLLNATRVLSLSKLYMIIGEDEKEDIKTLLNDAYKRSFIAMDLADIAPLKLDYEIIDLSKYLTLQELQQALKDTEAIPNDKHYWKLLSYYLSFELRSKILKLRGALTLHEGLIQPLEGEIKLCEFCQMRPSNLAIGRLNLCNRCKMFYERGRGKGAFIDDVADEENYVALLAFEINHDQLLKGNDFNNYYLSSGFNVPWTIERALERLADIHIMGLRIWRELVRHIKEMIKYNPREKRFHITLFLAERADLKGFVDVVIDDLSVSAFVGGNKCELIGVPYKELDKVQDCLKEDKIVFIDGIGVKVSHVEPMPKEVQAEDRVVPVAITRDVMVFLAPAAVIPSSLPSLLEYIERYPMKLVRLEVIKAWEPLYVALMKMRS